MGSSPPPTYLPGWHDEEKVQRMRYAKLGDTDLVVSQAGIGGAVVGNVYPDAGGLEEIYQCIEQALKAGLNYIDTAPFYGQGKSEEVLGKALRRVPRHTYYIGTKVGRYGATWETAFDFSEERILAEFDLSLKRLQLPYVDLVQIHDFEFAQDPARIAKETLPLVEKIVASGRARYIGITGFDLEEFHKVLDMTETKVDAVLNFARNVFVDTALKDHLGYFQSKSLGIINASPTNMGLLTNAGPPPWHPAKTALRELCSKAGKMCQERGVELGKLSVWHNLATPEIHTTLLGFGNLKVLQINLSLILDGLTKEEEEMYRELQETLFKQVDPKVADWMSVWMEQFNSRDKTNK